jgi:formylglycine-generating enzyme required for sulfatase activity
VTGETPWRGKKYGNLQSKTEPQFPAAFISWQDIEEKFLPKLGSQFALPTEAQWEYACRAGNMARFFWGDAVAEAGQYANVADASGSKKHRWTSYVSTTDNFATLAEVGRLKSNAFGLFDMTGNVSEWCRDRFTGYTADEAKDPLGPTEGGHRVVRGGAWNTYDIRLLRSAGRSDVRAADSYSYLGARLVLVEVH